MNIATMNEEIETLKTVVPTSFVYASCSFWGGAMITFTKNLPEQHKKAHLYKCIWSLEALAAFKKCISVGTIKTTAI